MHGLQRSLELRHQSSGMLARLVLIILISPLHFHGSYNVISARGTDEEVTAVAVVCKAELWRYRAEYG